VRALALAAALALACRARHRPPAEVPPDVVRAPDPPPDAAVPRLRSDLVLATLVGEVRRDVSHRCVGAEPAVGGVQSAREGDAVACGDGVETGPRASVTLRCTSGATARLGEETVAEVPAYAGAALVVSRGVVDVVAPFESAQALRVDTPAGRVIVSAGAASISVADDGAVRVSAGEGAVTLWPSPAVGAAPRAVASRGLDAGRSAAFAPYGAPLSTTRLRLSPRAWIARRNTPATRDAARTALVRAGEADLDDARALLARLRQGTAERDRDAALGALSLALGRLNARARRARALSEPSALAGFESLREEARAWAPLR
jgi:hypothetical protein